MKRSLEQNIRHPPNALNICYSSNSFICAIIAVASGKRGVIVHSNGRGCLKESEPVIPIAKLKKVELRQYLHGESTIDGFERVWNNGFPCFIFDG